MSTKIEIKKGLTCTGKGSIEIHGKIYFFGFDSHIEDLRLILEYDSDRHEIHVPETSYGFVSEAQSGKATVWMEYASTDKDYLVNLYSNTFL
jgi:hypothetical protein